MPQDSAVPLSEQAFISAEGEAALEAFDGPAQQAARDALAAAQPAIQLELDYVLLEPVSLGKEMITTVRLTEPTMKQLRESQRASNSLAGLSVLIQLNTGLLPGVIDKLKQRDVTAIDDFFAQFSRR